MVTNEQGGGNLIKGRCAPDSDSRGTTEISAATLDRLEEFLAPCVKVGPGGVGVLLVERFECQDKSLSGKWFVVEGVR